MANTSAPRNEKTCALSVRFTEQDAIRVDKHLVRMREKTPRLQVSRTDAIRELLLRGLDDAERAR
jgi:hypothetical protein